MPKGRVWMPFYVGDYLRDTMHLTTEEHGAYLLLILAYWSRGGPLPNDDRWLAHVVGVGASHNCLRKWRQLRPTLERFFIISDVWTHSRIETELAALEERSKSASAAASVRWSKNAQVSLPLGSDANAYAERMPRAHMRKACLTSIPIPIQGEGEHPPALPAMPGIKGAGVAVASSAGPYPMPAFDELPRPLFSKTAADMLRAVDEQIAIVKQAAAPKRIPIEMTSNDGSTYTSGFRYPEDAQAAINAWEKRKQQIKRVLAG
jgi:uncharacterized protein YdaU (DUF1376 family)